MSFEKLLNTLQDEIRDLKNAYEQTGSQMPTFSHSIDYTTKANHIVESSPGGSSEYDTSGVVILTYDTISGANTLASLEVASYTQEFAFESAIWINRVPYRGGARWRIVQAAVSGSFTFTVRSNVDGNLSAKMSWE